jgi:predicted nucleotidyltransferase
MPRAELLARLATLKPWLAAEGITRLRLFGSHARDEAGAESDVDLIADLSRPLGLRFFTLQDELSDRLGLKVDLVTEAALAPDIRYAALRDALDA